MRKKEYLKPTIDIVKLKQQKQLLAGSGVAKTDPYTQGRKPIDASFTQCSHK